MVCRRMLGHSRSQCAVIQLQSLTRMQYCAACKPVQPVLCSASTAGQHTARGAHLLAAWPAADAPVAVAREEVIARRARHGALRQRRQVGRQVGRGAAIRVGPAQAVPIPVGYRPTPALQPVQLLLQLLVLPLKQLQVLQADALWQVWALRQAPAGGVPVCRGGVGAGARRARGI